MKKSTTILYLSLGLLLGLFASCTPCDDGDSDETTNTEVQKVKIDSTSIR